ncbi:MAG TPA: hypothetical protein VMH05_10670 [Bryobacteraceae bacterium]|nr:hypothetical protein [Bryobacteraceae bacterium]
MRSAETESGAPLPKLTLTGETSSARRIACYAIPLLFCLAVHWRDLRMWFFNDDFAWLGLPQLVHSPGDLVHVLFSPMAEGTVRTLSERLFFLVFSSVFGLHSPPFRIWVFLTTFASIVLLVDITRRLTGSALAGAVAAMLWTANAGLAMAIGWSSAYNQIAFAFFLLLAFRLLLLYIDTQQRKFWIWQWVVFILGFGALELNVMYPVLAAGYALCCARPFFRKTLLLFIPSALFAAWHLLFIPAPTDPYYHPYYGAALLATFWQYWSYALGALRDAPEDWRPLWLGVSCTLAVTAALLLFAVGKLRKRDWLPMFLLAWFVAMILPVLPFKNHFTEYYVTAPALGLAMLAGWALSKVRGALLAAAVAICAVYLTVSLQDTTVAERYFYDRSRKLKYLITGLQALPKADASKKIILAGVNNDLFWTGFLEDPFRLIGITDIYLLPGSERAIDTHPEWGGIGRYVLSPDNALQILTRHEGAVYQLEGRQLRDVTAPHWTELAEYVALHSRFLDVGDPASTSRLGPTWYRIENQFRWMPQKATLKIAGPQKDGQLLEVTGYCPAPLLASGPLEVTFLGDGVKIASAKLTDPDKQFDLQFPIPPQLVGRQQLEIEIEVNRTAHIPGDPRQLGLIFGTFRIK